MRYMNIIEKRVSIFLPISRPHRVAAMAEQLAHLELGDLKLDAIVIVADNIDITQQIIQDTFWRCKVPGTILYANSSKQAPAEMNIGERRSRIVQAWEIAKRMIPDTSAVVFCLEDDTEAAPNALMSLFKSYATLCSRGKVGLVSGVQAGRWAYKMIGAWKVNNPKELSEAWTLPFRDRHVIEPVDAAGFYCFITSRDLFVNTEYRFGQFGPDFYFGVDAKAKGYQNFVDWGVIAKHVVDRDGRCIVPDQSCIVVRYKIIDGLWRLVEPTSRRVG